MQIEEYDFYIIVLFSIIRLRIKKEELIIMDKEKQKRAIIVRIGLCLIDELKKSFEKSLKYINYAFEALMRSKIYIDTINTPLEFPSEIKGQSNNRIIETQPVDIKILLDKIETLTAELDKFPNELESLWGISFIQGKDNFFIVDDRKD